MERILTEAELKIADADNLMRWNSNDIGSDAQDGILKTFSGCVKLSDDLIKSVGERIEQWMDAKTEDNILGFNVTDSSGDVHELSFDKYVVNFQAYRNGVAQWLLVKCRQEGYPRFHTRYLQTIQLSGDCYVYGENDIEISPNVFNLLSPIRYEGRKHSSMLSESKL